jgi:hypothetical protein
MVAGSERCLAFLIFLFFWLLYVLRIARNDELALLPDGLCVVRNASYVCEIDYCAIGYGSQNNCRAVAGQFSVTVARLRVVC